VAGVLTGSVGGRAGARGARMALRCAPDQGPGGLWTVGGVWTLDYSLRDPQGASEKGDLQAFIFFGLQCLRPTYPATSM
jgi:hypothetical protein